jgi:hypothetical protein
MDRVLLAEEWQKGDDHYNNRDSIAEKRGP